jgi:hypothetical protein
MARDHRRSPFSRLAVGAGFVVAGYTVVALNLGIGFAVPGFVMMMLGGVGFLFSPLGRALTRSLEHEAGTVQPAEVPEQVLAELDELRARLAELEERQDFSERLLAQRGDAARLGDQ